MRQDPDPWAESPFRYSAHQGPFSPEKLFQHPGPLSQYDAGNERKKICIVGGGIAGLTAAYELAALGYPVTVLEASARWGGRIYTYRFGDGTYGELGAMRIPEEHKCVSYYLDKFGLANETREFVGENSKGYYFLRNKPFRMDEWWQKAGTLYLLAAGEVRETPAYLIADRMVAPAWLLVDPDDKKWEQYSNRLITPRLRLLENTSLEQAASGALSQYIPGLSAEAWEGAGRATNDLWLECSAMLHWLRENKALSAGKYEIKDGMDRVVTAFLDGLRRSQTPPDLRLKARALSLSVGDQDVEVIWEDPYRGRLADRFAHVICTTPARATTRIQFLPRLPPEKREALANLSYLSAGKTLMHCSVRHWELWDGIYGGRSVSDLLNQQCWYPSDNSIEVPDDRAPHKIAMAVGDAAWHPFDAPMQVIDRTAISVEASNAPSVFLAAYMWGTNARHFASLTDRERDDTIRENVAKIHPRNDNYLLDIIHYSWDEQLSPAGGAFAWFAPGEQRRYQAALCEPIRGTAGVKRILFAGEHIGITHGWIQSAMQSALAAAIDVIS